MPNRDVAERYFAEQSKGNIPGALACFGPEVEFTAPAGRVPFPDGVRAYLEGFQGSFPGNSFEVANVLEAGDQVAIEGFWVGKQSGTMQLPDGRTIPATNKEVRAPFVTVFRVTNGKIASHRAYWDMAGFMAQLGLS